MAKMKQFSLPSFYFFLISRPHILYVGNEFWNYVMSLTTFFFIKHFIRKDAMLPIPFELGKRDIVKKNNPKNDSIKFMIRLWKFHRKYSDEFQYFFFFSFCSQPLRAKLSLYEFFTNFLMKSAFFNREYFHVIKSHANFINDAVL